MWWPRPGSRSWTGIAVQQEGGIRSAPENDILAREGGSVDLMETIPNEAEAVEELMGR
jgi:hypothetical protein